MAINSNFDQSLALWKQDFAVVETNVLNIMDDTIILTSISATLRELMAWVQGIASLSFACYYAIEATKATAKEKEKLNQQAADCLGITKHAVLNHGRAMVAAVPLIGAISLLAYDWILKERLKYEGESANPIKDKIVKAYTDYAPPVIEAAKPYAAEAQKNLYDYSKAAEARVKVMVASR